MNIKNLTLCVFLMITMAACEPANPTATSTLQPTVTSTLFPTYTPVPTRAPTAEPVPESVLMVGQKLAQQLDLEPAQVVIVSLEEATWENDCLGIILEGAACQETETQGFIVVFQVGDDQYSYHMDESGEIVRLALAPAPQVGNPIISWQFLDTVCQAALIGDEGVAFGECNAPMIAAKLVSQNRLADLEYIREAFFPFQADTPAGKIVFTGLGTLKPTSAEKRMVAEWARLVYQEALSGHSNASYGLAFAWHREGGFVGFCDDISVYLTGEINATSCKSGTTTGLGRSRLDAAQLAQVYAWVDEFSDFEISLSDGDNVEDGLTTYLAFLGLGENKPTDDEQQVILKFASDLYAGFTPAGANEDIDSARQTLFNFFQLLHDGEYREATDLFGGSYGFLIDMNPDIPSHDFEGLLKNGCTNNGLQCKLVGQVIDEHQIADKEFSFTVEFINDDGSLFTIGSCCGEEATIQPLKSQFEYTVVKEEDSFYIMELPQYIP